jgi:hypothetical protein
MGQGADNQGVNSTPANNPNPVPSSPNSASPAATGNNDQNKPLYERQATDIPWAQQSGGNTGTPPPPH